MPAPSMATFLALHPQNNILAVGLDDSTIMIYNICMDEVHYLPVIDKCSWRDFHRETQATYLLPTNVQVESQHKGHFGKITGLACSKVLSVLVSTGADAQASFFFPHISSITIPFLELGIGMSRCFVYNQTPFGSVPFRRDYLQLI